MERGQLDLTPQAVDSLLEELQAVEGSPSLLQTKLTSARETLSQDKGDIVAITVSEQDVSHLIDLLPAPSPEADQEAIDLRDYLTTFLRKLRS